MIKINYYILIFVVIVLTGGMQAIEQIMAQDDLPIQVVVTPQDSVAAVGSLFLYTITVTNTSTVPVDDVVVSATVPRGSSFSHTESKQRGWLTSQGQADKIDGQVLWFRSEAMQPQEVAMFELFVKVQDDFAGQNLVSNAFVTIGTEDLFEAHDGATADVLAVTPTVDLSTPTLSREEIFQTRVAHGATVIAQKTGAAVVLQQTSQASATQAELSATSTPSALDSTVIVDVPTSESIAASTEAASQSFFCCFSGLIIVGLLSFLVVFNR